MGCATAPPMTLVCGTPHQCLLLESWQQTNVNSRSPDGGLWWHDPPLPRKRGSTAPPSVPLRSNSRRRYPVCCSLPFSAHICAHSHGYYYDATASHHRVIAPSCYCVLSRINVTARTAGASESTLTRSGKQPTSKTQMAPSGRGAKQQSRTRLRCRQPSSRLSNFQGNGCSFGGRILRLSKSTAEGP